MHRMPRFASRRCRSCSRSVRRCATVGERRSDLPVVAPPTHRFLSSPSSQPIACGVAARHFIQVKKRTQPVIATQRAQIPQRPPTAGEHRNQRQDMNRRAVSGGAARAGQFMIDQVAREPSPRKKPRARCAKPSRILAEQCLSICLQRKISRRLGEDSRKRSATPQRS
jgi:hypothetical protein